MDRSQALDPKQAIWRLLPLHPPPQPFESFSSYVCCLQEANGLQSLNELAALANTRWSHLTSFPDYPSPPYQGLTLLTGYTEADLESTTFHYLAQQFGCSLHSQPIRRFLQNSLASTLRYCPICLKEQTTPYYSLIWRFSAIPVCKTHRCALLDRCGHCGTVLPLLTQRSRIAQCQACQGDLRSCPPGGLPNGIEEFMYDQIAGLEKLLSSQQASLPLSPALAIGRYFSFLRRERNLSLSQVSSLGETSELVILHIERGNPSRDISFEGYVQYARALSVSLGEIVEAAFSQEDQVILSAEHLFARVDTTAQRLLAEGIPVTPGNIAKHSGVSAQQLRAFPAVNSLLDTLNKQHRATTGLNTQHEEELVQQVESAIQQLRQRGEPLTQLRGAQMLGLTYQSLRSYPRVEELLMQIPPAPGQTTKWPYLASVLERRATRKNHFIRASAEIL